MVPTAAAQSSAVGSPSSPGPNRTATSPGSTGSSPQSSTIWSMHTRPAMRPVAPGQPYRRAVAGGPRDAVGVPERHQGQGRLGRGGVRVAVRDALTGRHPLGQHHPGAHRHRRPQAEGLGPARARARSTAMPGPDQVEMGVGAGQRGGRVRDVAHRRRDAVRASATASPSRERGQLPVGGRVVRARRRGRSGSRRRRPRSGRRPAPSPPPRTAPATRPAVAPPRASPVSILRWTRAGPPGPARPPATISSSWADRRPPRGRRRR